ncbi:MAG: hypothetical protein PHN44_02315 [Candidatus Marinimicrobia bacterium]|nr:hypothetical protein [Candidatus Neomarinimicrobiota bacterium]MDD5539828.1 hypothetical protein [Candidatus Neomarinimicrobiota bacterium]
MSGVLLKAIVAAIVACFVFFVVVFAMGTVIDTFLYITSMFPMAQGGIGQRLLPSNMLIFNWFYTIVGFLILVLFIWVIKILFFSNRYEDEEEFDYGQRRF